MAVIAARTGSELMAGAKAMMIQELKSERDYDEVIYMSPDGEILNQNIANELSLKGNIIILCGHYEGVDQRVIDEIVDEEISIGDYVLSSGELAATVIIDSVYRLVDGVISSESLEEESYCDGLLEYPQYTHPEEWRGMKVPPVLLSGNHAEIRKWRLRNS